MNASLFMVMELVFKVLLLRGSFAFSVSSWGRTEARNKAVGGHPESRHLDWCAVDCVLDNLEVKTSFITRAVSMGLVAIDEGDHIHLQLKYRV